MLSDLEMTKLCAEAMGIKGKPAAETTHWFDSKAWDRLKDCLFYGDGEVYDPLHDDAQCFALVKRFPIECLNAMCREGSKDLNRAIVECVAKIQKDK